MERPPSRIFCGLLFALVLFAGCEFLGSDDTGSASRVILLAPGEPWPDGDPVHIERASIEGDFLRLTLAFSGGCAEHDFSFYSSGPIIKTLPPTADFIVVHDDHDDACDAWLSEEHLVFVQPVRSTDSHAVRLHLVDSRHRGETTITYRY